MDKENYINIYTYIQWIHTYTTHIHIGEGNGNPLHYSCLENPMDGINTCNTYAVKYYSVLKLKKVLPFATRMNLKDIMLNGISQTQNDKYFKISLI